MRAKVVPLVKKKGCCRSCGGTTCEICKHVVTTETFRSFSTQREYCIRPDNLIVPAMLCIFFHANHARNNTQGVLKVFALDLTITSQPVGVSLNTVEQASFHAHFEDDKHGINDWEITLID